MVGRDEMSDQTFDKFLLLLGRFTVSMNARGAVLLQDADAELVEEFVTSRGWTRHGLVSEAAPATQSLRRSVISSECRDRRSIVAVPALCPARGMSGRREALGGVHNEAEHDELPPAP